MVDEGLRVVSQRRLAVTKKMMMQVELLHQLKSSLELLGRSMKLSKSLSLEGRLRIA